MLQIDYEDEHVLIFSVILCKDFHQYVVEQSVEGT